MCVDMCIDVCIDIWVNLCFDTRVGMYLDMYLDTYVCICMSLVHTSVQMPIHIVLHLWPTKDRQACNRTLKPFCTISNKTSTHTSTQMSTRMSFNMSQERRAPSLPQHSMVVQDDRAVGIRQLASLVQAQSRPDEDPHIFLGRSDGAQIRLELPGLRRGHVWKFEQRDGSMIEVYMQDLTLEQVT